jgi:hypothetical protein
MKGRNEKLAEHFRQVERFTYAYEDNIKWDPCSKALSSSETSMSGIQQNETYDAEFIMCVE